MGKKEGQEEGLVEVTPEDVNPTLDSEDGGKTSDPQPKSKSKATRKETSTDDGKKSGDGGDQKTLTQEQVNELIGNVRGEARETAVKKLLKDLGVESVDDVKEKLESLNKIERERMSEQEKLQKDLEDAKKVAEALQGENTQIRQEAQENLIRATIANEAAGKFASPDVAYQLIDRDLIKIDDDGNLEGVDKALKALGEKYPFLLADKKNTLVSQVSGTNPDDPDADAGRTDDDRRQEYFGMGVGKGFFDGEGLKPIVDND